MTGQNVTQVLHVLDKMLSCIAAAPVDERRAAAWQRRLKSGQPAIDETEFPVTDAAYFLIGIVRHEQGRNLTQGIAEQLILHYLAEQAAGALWQENGIAAKLGEAWSHLACQTALARAAETVAKNISLADWQHRECPVCGTLPVFASLDGDGGQRSLVCGSCFTHWRFKRIGCAFCGEEQPEQLKVLTAEEFPGWSAAVCLTCHGYIKTADLRHMAVRPRWQQAALTTLPLDYAAVRWLDNFRSQRATS